MELPRDGAFQESMVVVQTEIDLSVRVRFINIDLCECRIVISLRKQSADLMAELSTDPKCMYATRAID